MKILKAALAIVIVTALVFSAACAAGSSSATPKTQLLAVQRGNLSTDISAAGNLALSNKEDLAIEISGTQQDPVTVREVLVKEGDSVKKGQVLVRLDVSVLEDRVTAQQRVVRLGEQAVNTAQTALDKVIQDSNISISQSEMDLETAVVTYNRLNYPFNFSTFAFDMPAAIANLNDAQRQLQEAQAGLTAGPGSADYGTALDKLRRAQENLTVALERLSKGLGVSVYGDVSHQGPEGSYIYPSENKTYADVSPIVSNYLSARAAKIAAEKAQNSLAQTKASVQINIDKAQLSVDNAKDDLEEDRKTLAEDEADVKKNEIVAPFDGFVTAVNVAGGDAVQRGTIPVQVADPTKFQADIMVSEMDILQVKMGGAAQVQVASMPGLTLSANVTAISPTATIQSGVVNYKITVEVASMESIMQQWQAARQQAAQQLQQQQGDATTRTRPATGQGSTGQTRQGLSTNVTAPALSNLQLKDGLTVTVSIVLDQRNNVLMVPNTAITRQGGKSLVKVSNATGTIEDREIKTGISNWQYTEVTEGLNEGEKVVVPQGTSATSATQQRPQGAMGGMPPGGIRIIR